VTAPRRSNARAGAGVLAVLLLLAGCGAAGEEPDVVEGTGGTQAPSGTVTLLETRPQPVGGATVVAYNVVDGRAGVSVATGDGPADSATVQVGDDVDVAGETWQVLTITPGGGSDGSPGSKSGEVVLGRQG
jgi:hypothetical protein